MPYLTFAYLFFTSTFLSVRVKCLIFFFFSIPRQDNGMDQLIKEVIEDDLVLQAIIGDVEMLIFPSILLPNRHQSIYSAFSCQNAISSIDEAFFVTCKI